MHRFECMCWLHLAYYHLAYVIVSRKAGLFRRLAIFGICNLALAGVALSRAGW